MKLLIDTHSHLDHPRFRKDLEDVLDRARKNNLSVIICNGLNKKSNRKVLELSKKCDIIESALGIFPIDAQKLTEEQIDKEIEFIEKNKDKIKAIGEVGLDYHWEKDKHKQEKQRIIFKKFIELAKRIDKPIIIHTRKAEKDALDMIKESKLKKVIFHCFGGSNSLTKEIADNGYFFSIPANIVKCNSFKEIVKNVPLSQLFTETDSPYLSPNEKRNEPSNVIYTIEEIAKIKGLDKKEVINIIYMNYQRIF
ncbi:TatD family hydrolase [Candidatus Woesearchaeota archaeon]|nr:TatD family hydrolase [Candidatus Woesearchaeota archaeon]